LEKKELCSPNSLIENQLFGKDCLLTRKMNYSKPVFIIKFALIKSPSPIIFNTIQMSYLYVSLYARPDGGAHGFRLSQALRKSRRGFNFHRNGKN
jgi:hypothetical protein